MTEKQQALAELKKIVKPGLTIFTDIKYLSHSRFVMDISMTVLINGEVIDINHLVSKALGLSQENGGVRVGAQWKVDTVGPQLVKAIETLLWPDEKRGGA